MSRSLICVPPARNRVFLIHRSGVRYTFPSAAALGRYLLSTTTPARAARQDWGINIGLEFCEVRWLDFNPAHRVETLHDYIVRDDLGNRLSVFDIPRPPRKKTQPSRRDIPHDYRAGAVPGTGLRLRYGRCWMRGPQTHSARRSDFDPIEEHEPRLRRARGTALPTAWDDLPRQHQRSWKKNRATQWRPSP
jgi:hypothetical protein